MGLMKLCLFLFVIVVVVTPHSSAFPESTKDWARAYGAPDFAFFGGLTPAGMSEHGRHLLFQYGYDTTKYSRKKYLSYYALRKNNIPCGRRGSSYYDCRKRERVNPYRRGCSALTGCARFLD